MKKFFPAMFILMSLVFIGLFILSFPKKLTYSFFTSTNNVSAKPVISPIYIPNKHFISDLANFTYVAHRGAPEATDKPENSLPAYRASKNLGYKIVETDLQLTKDGQWIIMHDSTLDRTTKATGKISDHLFKEVTRLKLKNNKTKGSSVPSLDEFLKLCSTEELIPILDIKPNETQMSSQNYDSLTANLDKYHLLDKVIFCSSSKEVLSELRIRNKFTAIAVMMDASEDNLDFTRILNNAFIYCDYKSLTENKIDLINKYGLRFGVWTINDEKTAKYFLGKGALMIVTDNLRKEI